MTIIGELSDKPQYTIKAVCQQTGILAVTIRAWERRYNFLKPQRTEGNYRLYSDQDVAVLRWLKYQVDMGVSISSAVASLKEMRRDQKWPELLPNLELRGAPKTAVPPAHFASRLYSSLILLDEEAADAMLQEAHAVFDLTTIFMEVIAPCFVELGEAWHRGEILISKEHYATNYLRGRLMTLMQSYPMRRTAPRLVIACPADERHDVGSLMLTILLRREGYRVDFLGADVPTEDLINYAQMEKPAMVCVSASTMETAEPLKRMAEALKAASPRMHFGFGGRVFMTHPLLRHSIDGHFLGETVVEACTTIRQLVGTA